MSISIRLSCDNLVLLLIQVDVKDGEAEDGGTE